MCEPAALASVRCEIRAGSLTVARMAESRLPRVVWLLGLVSLCMDLSSEMIHSLLPVFLVSTLGASTVTLGLIEGVAEGTALIAKIFSGVLSDRFGRRKPLVVLGYGLAALSKPLFPLATSAGWVLLRGSPTELARAFAVRLAMHLLADADPAGSARRRVRIAAIARYGRRIAWPAGRHRVDECVGGQRAGRFLDSAVLPALVAVAVLVLGVEEPSTHADATTRTNAAELARCCGRLGRPFWIVAAIGAVFTLARFSEAFLVVRANDVGSRSRGRRSRWS